MGDEGQTRAHKLHLLGSHNFIQDERNRTHPGWPVRQPLVLSSGKSSQMSMASTPLVPTMVTPTSSWRESTSTTMKPQEAKMYHVPSWWILSPVPWTLSVQDLLDRSSDQTTLSLDRVVLETTGLRVTTQRVLNS